MATYGMVAPVLSVAVFPRDILTIVFMDGRMRSMKRKRAKIEKRGNYGNTGELGDNLFMYRVAVGAPSLPTPAKTGRNNCLPMNGVAHEVLLSMYHYVSIHPWMNSQSVRFLPSFSMGPAMYCPALIVQPGDRSDILRGMMPLLYRVLCIDCDSKNDP
jgi:hypothetical protein